MKVSISKAENGFILSDGSVEHVFSFDYYDAEYGNTEIDAVIQLFYSVADKLVGIGSRYDRERIHITKKVGDKYVLQIDEVLCPEVIETVAIFKQEDKS